MPEPALLGGLEVRVLPDSSAPGAPGARRLGAASLPPWQWPSLYGVRSPRPPLARAFGITHNPAQSLHFHLITATKPCFAL